MRDMIDPFEIGYLAHDLFDKGIERRAAIFAGGGARVVTVGFRRRLGKLDDIGGARPIELGFVRDAALGRRALAVLAQALRVRAWAKHFERSDILVVKSLEMLVLAVAAKDFGGLRAPIIYEICDIHRSLLSPGISGKFMRWLERRLLTRCSRLITTSPAFVEYYFRGVQRSDIDVLLLENKSYMPEGAAAQPTPTAAREFPRPWIIGWFGIIRCRKSLELLRQLVLALPGQVEVVIAGRIAHTEFEDFEGVVAATPGLTFIGPYELSDLGDLYAKVHFTWAIDYYEEGGNSEWLLPNRIYEGGAFNAISIALATVETGRWLRDRGLGVLITEPVEDLTTFYADLTDEKYIALTSTAAAAPRSYFITDQSDAVQIVHALVPKTIDA